MTNNVNVSDLAQLAQTLLDNNVKHSNFMLSQVHRITRGAYEQYPEDPVIRQFAFVIEQMTDKRGPAAIITRAELTSIYNDLVRLSSNTKFKKVLGSLIYSDGEKPKDYTSVINHMRVDADNSQLDPNEYLDQNLVNALNGVFGGDVSSVAYNQKVASKGAELVSIELNSLGLNPKIEVLGGDHNTIVYGAKFDTREGLVTVAVPLDVSGDKLLLPSVFVADNRFEELRADTLSYFVDKKATTKDFSVPATNSILKAAAILTGKETAAGDDYFNTMASNFGAGDGEIEFTNNLPQQKNAEDTHFDTTVISNEPVKLPQALAHLSQDLDNDLLETMSQYGRSAVRSGVGVVLAELAAAGFRNSQVRFGGEAGDSVIYLAAIHTPKGPVEIEVPISMTKDSNDRYRPLLPSIFAYDGLVEDFTAERLQRFAANRPGPSSGDTVCSTAHSYMTLPELRKEIIKSVAEKDYVTCEMILGTIQDRFGEEHYINAVSDYHNILMIKTAHENYTSTHCSKEIAAGKGSIEARCGHFGVPMSKVVVGEDGLCKLRAHLERERLNPMEDTGASISTSKIFFT